MTALALDIGVRTGWARSGGQFGVLDVAESSSDDHGWSCATFSDWVEEFLVAPRPDVLIIEQCVFAGRFAHAGLVTGLIKIAHMHAWTRDIPRVELSANTVRKALCGTARATDAAIREAVNCLGFAIPEAPHMQHCADAAALICVHENRMATWRNAA